MSDDPTKIHKLPADDMFVADGAAGEQIPDLDRRARTPRSRRCRCRRSSERGSRASASRARPSSRRCCPAPTARRRRAVRLGDGAGRRAVRAVRAADRPAGAIASRRQLSSGQRSRAIRRSPPSPGASGAYRFAATRSSNGARAVSLRLPEGADRDLALNTDRRGVARPRPHQHAGLRPRPGRDRDRRPRPRGPARRAHRASSSATTCSPRISR